MLGVRTGQRRLSLLPYVCNLCIRFISSCSKGSLPLQLEGSKSSGRRQSGGVQFMGNKLQRIAEANSIGEKATGLSLQIEAGMKEKVSYKP